MFIVLESIDGGGKGFQRIEVTDYLVKKGLKVKSAEFPIHNAFYETVIHPALQGEYKMNRSSWVLSYLLDKTLYTDKINESLNKGELFIADGYFTTTIAYQSLLMKQVPLERLIQYGEEFEIPVPDLAVFLDVEPEIAMSRKHKEEGHEEGPDIFEKSIEKQRNLRKIFKRMVEEQIYCPWEIVDGNSTPDKVTKDILNVLKKNKIASL